MLCQFTVENFRSIKNPLTLDMQAASITENEDQIIVGEDGEKFLPLAVLYGPNGGGKSTVLEALVALTMKIMRPIWNVSDESGKKSDMGLRLLPFKFADETKECPTKFKILFRTNIAEYRYLLEVKKGIIVYEKLDKKNIGGSRTSFLFERNYTDKGACICQMKGSLAKIKVGEISESLPLLSYLGIAYRGNRTVKDIVAWFADHFQAVNYGNPAMEQRMRIVDDASQEKKTMLQLLEEMDIGISDYRIVRNAKETDEIEDVRVIYEIDGKTQELSLGEESAGTRKLFGLLPYIAEGLQGGLVTVIDELDAKIHPMILKHIIGLYADPKSNRSGAQLIFTSHDLSTMTGELFRRDEIWFVAKGSGLDSQMYSLVEFKLEDGSSVRKDAKYNKQYMEGKYGADPYLRKIIQWGKADDSQIQRG